MAHVVVDTIDNRKNFAIAPAVMAFAVALTAGLNTDMMFIFQPPVRRCGEFVVYLPAHSVSSIHTPRYRGGNCVDD